MALSVTTLKPKGGDAESDFLISRAGLALVCGRVYAVGGFNGSLRVRTVDLYEPNLDQWFPAPDMESRRSTLGVAVLNNCIYAVISFE